MKESDNEDFSGMAVSIDNFTEFFYNLDDQTLIEVAYRYPKALLNMCMFLTLDQQLRREKLENLKHKRKFVN